MPISGDLYTFSTENVERSPDVKGVYTLYDGDELIYYGRALGVGVTIRSRLFDHIEGREGRCTEIATAYRREATDFPKEREAELLREFYLANGRLPRCNARIG